LLAAFSICYSFSQKFSVPAIVAYEWCTDYRPDDFSLMGIKGKREIRKITENTIVLTETTYSGRKPIKKHKLVKLDPNRLSWSNTHISGPNRHSQFLYEIVAEGEAGSRLDFRGLQVNYSKTKMTPGVVASLELKAKEEDAKLWKLLAKKMEEQVNP